MRKREGETVVTSGKQTRNPSIELLRVLLMLAIVYIHIPNCGDAMQEGFRHMCFSCLVCFVVISGYYGIRFSFQKALRFALMGAYCSFIATVAYIVANGWHGWYKAFELWTGDLSDYWFLWAYVVLMFFAPFLNAVTFPPYAGDVKKYAQKVIISGGGVLLVVFCWGFVATMQYRHRYVPLPSGFEVMSPLTLIGIYVAIRIFVHSGIEKTVRLRHWLCIAAVCGVLCYGKWLFRYNCIVPLLLATSMFMVFKNGVRCSACHALVKFLAPSLFPVYLLHRTAIGRDMIDSAVASGVFPFKGVALSVAVALLVFVASLCIDIVLRRIPLALLRRSCNRKI